MGFPHINCLHGYPPTFFSTVGRDFIFTTMKIGHNERKFAFKHTWFDRQPWNCNLKPSLNTWSIDATTFPIYREMHTKHLISSVVILTFLFTWPAYLALKITADLNIEFLLNTYIKFHICSTDGKHINKYESVLKSSLQ